MRQPLFNHLLLFTCLATVVTALFLKSLVHQPPETPAANVQPNAPGKLQADPLIIHYHERRPYYITVEQGVAGFVGQRVSDALIHSGLPYTWQQTPAKRQLEIIKANDTKSCGTGWFKTKEREQWGRYSQPVYQDMPFVAIARADSPLLADFETIDSIMSKADVRLLVKEGYSYGSYIDSRISRFSPRIVTSNGDSQTMLNMIQGNRADYCFFTEEEAHEMLFAASTRRADFRLIHFTDVPNGSFRYLLCTRKVSDQEMDRLNSALSQIIGHREVSQ